jgi:hypothetical protein
LPGRDEVAVKPRLLQDMLFVVVRMEYPDITLLMIQHDVPGTPDITPFDDPV